MEKIGTIEPDTSKSNTYQEIYADWKAVLEKSL
jgi:hypothetical protein